MSDTLTFLATVEKVQTMTDGAIRVYLDLAETEIEAMAQLAAIRAGGLVLRIDATEWEPSEEKDNAYL